MNGCRLLHEFKAVILFFITYYVNNIKEEH